MKFNLSDFLQLDTKELLAVNGGFNCNGSSNTTVYPNTYYPSTPGGAGSNLPSSSRAVVGSSIRLDGTIRYDYDDGSHLFVYPDGQRQFYPGSDGKSKENNGKDASSSSGGGTCSSNNDTDKVSGMFGQITDGTYADRLTMQYYLHQHTADGDVTDKIMNDTKGENNEIIEAHSFSTDGCLMTVCAKIASEKLGRNVQLIEINNLFDKNSDGLLSYEEIEQGFEDLLGDNYNIEGHWKEESLSKESFEKAASDGDTYVLARAYGDFNKDGSFEHHWVVLEGYTTDADGRMVFSYDGSSDNDAKYNRVYVYGDPKSKNEYKIDKIETFKITSK